MAEWTTPKSSVPTSISDAEFLPADEKSVVKVFMVVSDYNTTRHSGMGSWLVASTNAMQEAVGLFQEF
jgi:hypothetical protein